MTQVIRLLKLSASRHRERERESRLHLTYNVQGTGGGLKNKRGHSGDVTAYTSHRRVAQISLSFGGLAVEDDRKKTSLPEGSGALFSRLSNNSLALFLTLEMGSVLLFQ